MSLRVAGWTQRWRSWSPAALNVLAALTVMWLLWTLLWLFIALLKTVLWLVVVLLITLWLLHDFIIYLPSFQGRKGALRYLEHNIRGYRTPSDFRLPYEDADIACADGIHIHAWLILQRQSRQRPTILFFHGNAGNIGYRLPNAAALYHKTGCNILLVEYRGFGNSEGRPSEPGLRLDADASLEYLRNHEAVDANQIIVFGRSLGGAVAIYTAHKHASKIRGLIVENTFTALEDMALVIFGRLGLSVSDPSRLAKLRMALGWFMRSNWPSIDRIGGCNRTPILFISGLQDELIPPAHMASLIERARGGEDGNPFVDVLEVPDGTHQDTYERCGEEYFERFVTFLAVCMSVEPPAAVEQ